MLLEPTIDKLNQMKLYGMAKALKEWADNTHDKDISPTDLVGLLSEREWVFRDSRKLQLRLANAKFKMAACLEDIDYSPGRGLSKSVVLELASSRWVQQKHNIILSGPTGVGKSHLACALGNRACRDGYSVIYRRVSRLFDEMATARIDGTFPHLLKRLAKANVLILDDFGLDSLSVTQRRDFLEVVEDRYNVSSTVITSQLEPKEWHAVIGDPTIADAICDRLVHNSHRLSLSGESIRKKQATKTGPADSKKAKEEA